MEKLELDIFEDQIGYFFRNFELLKGAFGWSEKYSVKSMALLGDSILSTALIEELQKEGLSVGNVCNTKSRIASNRNLAIIYDELQMGCFYNGCDVQNVHSKGTVVEALIAALYLDSGKNTKAARKFLEPYIDLPTGKAHEVALRRYCKEANLSLIFKTGYVREDSSFEAYPVIAGIGYWPARSPLGVAQAKSESARIVLGMANIAELQRIKIYPKQQPSAPAAQEPLP